MDLAIAHHGRDFVAAGGCQSGFEYCGSIIPFLFPVRFLCSPICIPPRKERPKATVIESVYCTALVDHC